MASIDVDVNNDEVCSALSPVSRVKLRYTRDQGHESRKTVGEVVLVAQMTNCNRIHNITIASNPLAAAHCFASPPPPP